MKIKFYKPVLFLLFSVFILSFLIPCSFAAESLIKDRISYGKVIRTRMPPQLMIEQIQKRFEEVSPRWMTFWQTFVIEDDPSKDEYVVIARSVEKPWAIALLKPECSKPENYEKLLKDIESGGTPVRMNVLIGIKRTRSWFRYTVTVYEPMYSYWKDDLCYEWNLPPEKSKDKFYGKNYTMRVYAKNLKKQVYELISIFGGWKSPKKLMKIPAMKGPGQELIGEGIDEMLTDKEKKLSVEEQEKIYEKRSKEKGEEKK